MKNIITIFLFALGAGVATMPVIGAEASNPECPACKERQARHAEARQHFTARRERLAKELGLTADQQARMQSLMKEQKTAADAVRADAALTPEQQEAQVRQIRQDTKAKRQALLTPEQQKKAEALKAKHQERRREPDKNPGTAR